MVTDQLTRSTVTAEKTTSAVTIRLIGGAADIAGTRTILLPAEDPITVGEGFLRLCHQFPALGKMEGRLLFAANAEYASRECDLCPGDELALIPSASGGATS